MHLAIRIILPLLLILVGYKGYGILSKKDPLPKTPPPKQAAIRTTANLLKRENFQMVIETQGIARPHNRTSLTPRVSGRILSISPLFENGAFFKKDDILLELDPTDFEAALAGAQAQVARAEAALAQEEARAEQALLDWKDLGYTDPPSDLVLRKPQLKEAHANLKAARSGLTDATNSLSRTKIRAPYDGQVERRTVGLGQSVSPGTSLGDIFSTTFAEIRLPLSARQFSRINLPSSEADPPVPVTLTDALLEEEPSVWQGQIVRSEGVLDEKSRKLFVIARLDDPFSLKKKGPALRIGQPVRASIKGKTLKNVFVIPRTHLKGPNDILLIHPEELTIDRRRIDPIWTDPKHLIVREGIEEGWHLVTRRLPIAPVGAKVEIIPDEEPDEPGKNEDPEKKSLAKEQSK